MRSCNGPARLEYVSRIGVHVRAMSAMIDNLFELSRLEAGDISWTMERVPLEDLVLETVDAMRAQAEAGSVSVCAELTKDLEAARANPEQIQRVLFNLIQNAIRHTPADGSVTVRASLAEDAVQVEVLDTGHGIPPPSANASSTPLSRAATGRRAATAALASVSRSRGRSSRRTAGASGSRTPRSAPASASACQRQRPDRARAAAGSGPSAARPVQAALLAQPATWALADYRCSACCC